MNNEPIQFLPIKHPWDAHPDRQRAGNVFLVGVVVGVIGSVLVAWGLCSLISAIVNHQS